VAKSIKEWPKSERPRERLLSQGAGALSDAELLAVKADGVWRFRKDQFEAWIDRLTNGHRSVPQTKRKKGRP